MRRRERNIDFQQDQTVELVASDVLKQVGFSRNFNIWMGFLTVALVVCLYAYTIQLRKRVISYRTWGPGQLGHVYCHFRIFCRYKPGRDADQFCTWINRIYLD